MWLSPLQSLCSITVKSFCFWIPALRIFCIRSLVTLVFTCNLYIILLSLIFWDGAEIVCFYFSVAYVCLIFICSWYAFSLSLCCCSVVDSTHLDLLDLCRKPLRFDVIKVVFYIKMSCENSRYSCYPNILLWILFLKFIFQGFLCMWWCFIIPAVFE